MSPNQFTQKPRLEGVLHDASLHSEKVSWGRELTWGFLNSELSSQLFDLGRLIIVSVSDSLWTEGRASYSFNIKKVGHSSQWPSDCWRDVCVPSSFLKSPRESEETAAYSAESAGGECPTEEKEEQPAGTQRPWSEAPHLNIICWKSRAQSKTVEAAGKHGSGVHWSWLLAVKSGVLKLLKLLKNWSKHIFSITASNLRGAGSKRQAWLRLVLTSKSVCSQWLLPLEFISPLSVLMYYTMFKL